MLCVRSMKCPQHTDEQRLTVRTSLLRSVLLPTLVLSTRCRFGLVGNVVGRINAGPG